MIKLQQSQALTSHFESYWSIVKMYVSLYLILFFFSFFFIESHLGEEEQPLLIMDQARLHGKQFCAFAFQRKDSQNAWPLQMGTDLSKSSS